MWEDNNTWSKIDSPETPEDFVIEDSNSTDIGGFYTDPNHYKNNTFTGTRMISDMYGNELTDSITIIGTDNG